MSDTASPLSSHERMLAIDTLLSHVWMVRAFLKHSDEAADDDELAAVHRDLYDYMLALGGPLAASDPDAYLHLARKKLGKLKSATADFARIQPEISSHTNFQMARRSLEAAVAQIVELVSNSGPATAVSAPAQAGPASKAASS
ncbi:hypothetical protein Psta_1661 [Pirellula staleyi DSM 6068]|uniref:Uncharacterized protein n=1 Tax=Pirellula staleyi (strain ATCC 27377 / DSM 6068 / ICPB 4128) TaxID=530564 RepID=D2QYC2_PIRSD|nr:hypothetical protein [Pirellula staleyi]ADB16336.1 hypothetical protein Psta_1661 [Pirellula staleyi DSM 6068]